MKTQNSTVGEFHTVAHAPLGAFGALCGAKVVAEVARDPETGKFSRKLLTCKRCIAKVEKIQARKR